MNRIIVTAASSALVFLMLFQRADAGVLEATTELAGDLLNVPLRLNSIIFEPGSDGYRGVASAQDYASEQPVCWLEWAHRWNGRAWIYRKVELCR